MSVIDVAIGLVRDNEGRYCVSQRRADAHLGGLWEFPGGKSKPDESMLDALKRELQEELGIVVHEAKAVLVLPYHYSDRSVRLHVYMVDRYEGVPQSIEGQPVHFVSESQLLALPMPAANQAIIAQCVKKGPVFCHQRARTRQA